ncbi:MAG TPA: aminoacyl-tRNA hydrolase [Thermoanaerobaculia bacterium]|nr:aminoacyl-tRNA hydrolase [Thermoanaerobaculia bacterium]
MKLIVGLGNPGREYDKTRHNIGFRVVDAFARKFRVAFDRHEKDALTGRGRVAGRAVVLAKPLTWMNLSGSAVKGLAGLYVDSMSDMMVVYDDIDLPAGRLRIRERGSAGTHNGMKSIVAAIGTEEFPRLRVGIGGGSSEQMLSEYVLDAFSPEEEILIERAVGRAVDALVLFARGELLRAMNEFNRDPEIGLAEE